MDKKLWRVRITTECIVEAADADIAQRFAAVDAENIVSEYEPMTEAITEVTSLVDLAGMEKYGWDKGSIPHMADAMCIEEWLKKHSDE